MRSVKVYEEAWPLHTPFVISRGSRSEASVVVVEIEEDGLKASGNARLIRAMGKVSRRWRIS
jgi:L-alanine-DL-glutamate epimerase-like enolase superfamily enzyme